VAVVVTGSAGFLGTAVVGALREAGHDVIGIDRRPAPAPPRPDRQDRPDRQRYTHFTADLCALDDMVVLAIRTAEAVIHLAGCPGVRDDRPDARARRWLDNVRATQQLLAHVPRRTPLVVASSSSVYGGTTPGRGSRETDRPAPRGGYARSKLAAEQLCRDRLDSGGLVAIARPFTVAGEGQRADMALAQWLAAARDGRPLRILGSPERSRDITDVRQVARVLVALAQQACCGRVNIGTGVGHRLGELVAVVADVLGTEVMSQAVPAHPDEAADTLADTTRLRRLVGFVPHTDLRDVVARQAAASAAGAHVAGA
jgi:nucleoside-diphosphate-sugar epimerase